jgi:carbonic anhydrase/acetyltransferase-like protein (isoleucine patch superfamily)
MLKKLFKKKKNQGLIADRIFGDPHIDKDDFVSSKATIIGDVIIEKDVIVCPNVSLRADEGTPFRVRYGTNIQDGVILHGLKNRFVTDEDGDKYSIYIGSHSTIAHGAIIHGPTMIGKHTFVGFGAIVHNATIGRNCHIGFGAIVRSVTVPDYRYIEDGLIVNKQEIADALPPATKHLQTLNAEVVDYNKALVQKYKERRELRT